MQQIIEVRIALREIGVARVLVEPAGGLVEHHLRQRPLVDVGEQVVVVLQVLRALGRAGREALEVVERLVVRLEPEAALARVDHRTLVFRSAPAVGGGGVPAAGVPGPRHALRAERVADGLLVLRRQRMARRVGEIEAAERRRRDAARLVRRLQGIDGVAVGRDRAVEQLHRALQHRTRGFFRLEQIPLLVQARPQARRRVRIARRAGAHQPEMVQVRAAVSRHEEVIGERVVLRPLPQLHARAVEVAHDEGAGVRHGDVQVVPAAVDLRAVLVVGMDRARQQLVPAAVERRRVDAERAVRQLLGKAFIGHSLRGEDRGEMGQRGAVEIELRLLLVGGVGDAVGAGKQAVEVVEAAVLGVDDDDGLYSFQPPGGRRRASPEDEEDNGNEFIHRACRAGSRHRRACRAARACRGARRAVSGRGSPPPGSSA